MGQKAIGGCAFPLRIGRREMITDITRRDGAEQRVGEGMKASIGIGMANKAVRVGDGYTAEPDMIASAEGMDIETAGSAGDEVAHGAFEILWLGNFISAFITRCDGDFEALGKCYGKLVRGTFRCCAVRCEKSGVSESLRCLDAPKLGAVDAGGEMTGSSA